MFEWVDPTREALQKYLRGRTDFLASLPGQLASFNLSEAMARQPKPFDRSQTGQQMLDAALNAGPSGLLGKIVYHGSPHKFDKFDASKIGTGEGAQAYGHGVYLADAEDVARGYQAALGGGDTFMRGKLAHKNGTSSLSLKFDYPDAIKTDAEELAADAMSRFGNKRQAIGYVETRTSAFNGPSPETKKSAIELLSNGAVEFKPAGSLYKADLPDEWIPKMLDWDKPLKEQPKEVQAALADEVAKYINRGAKVPSAGMIIKSMEYLDKETGKFGGPQGIAAKLKGFGVTGIRYLDGGSRGTGQGSYNYVVFPGLEDQVKILERNGIPLEGMFKMGK